LAFDVAFHRPEAAGVGGQHFVHQGQGAVFVEAEFELGVGDDDAAAGGVFDGGTVQGDGGVTDLGGQFLADDGLALFEGDVLVVVADGGLGRRGEDGL